MSRQCAKCPYLLPADYDRCPNCPDNATSLTPAPWGAANLLDRIRRAERAAGAFGAQQRVKDGIEEEKHADALSEALLAMVAGTEASEAAVLRAAIQAYLDGDYDGPRAHRPQPCRHGLHYYESCEACVDEHFRKALDSAAVTISAPPAQAASEIAALADHQDGKEVGDA